MSNIKTANLNVSLKQLFLRWLDITKAFNKLNNQEQQVLALLLYYHYIFKKDITNNKILWKVVFDYDTKLKISEELKMNNISLHNILTRLRKKNAIVDKEINPYFIPDLTSNSNNFKIVFNFNIIDNE